MKTKSTRRFKQNRKVSWYAACFSALDSENIAKLGDGVTACEDRKYLDLNGHEKEADIYEIPQQKAFTVLKSLEGRVFLLKRTGDGHRRQVTDRQATKELNPFTVARQERPLGKVVFTGSALRLMKSHPRKVMAR